MLASLLKFAAKIFFTVYLTILYFSTWRTGDFWVRLEQRLRDQRARDYGPELSMLIPQEGEKTWGEKRRANKCHMVSAFLGYWHRMNMVEMRSIWRR